MIIKYQLKNTEISINFDGGKNHLIKKNKEVCEENIESDDVIFINE